MRLSQILSSLVLCALLIAPSTLAFETDQYALPPKPLADIGDEVSDHVARNIALAVESVNAEIGFHERCLEVRATKGCGRADKERRKLDELRSPQTIAKAVYKLLGEGTIFTGATAKWFGKHKFAHEPSRFKPDYSDSIFVTMPLNYLTISPTVRMYGSEFGFDKIDHFFQQGYKYYKIYNDAIAGGKTSDEAARKAIKWGQGTERTYFGTLVSGVYSNGDLFANYAGMKFYQGLTESVAVGEHRLPPLVTLIDGKWKFDDKDHDILKPFITDHLNEALNPSGFSFLLASVVKSIVTKKDCPAWRKLYPNANAEEFRSRTAALENWNGEDYGFTKKSKTVPIAVCFEE